ncbi:MAG: hypothetical protein IJL26_13520 [Clostridia bacterium]|nr:hypothetical protein [Clostridia bacterium]
MRKIAPKNRTRTVILSVLAGLIALIYVGDLFSVQVVHGEEYREKMRAVTEYTVPVKAARGDILDRNGNVLVTERQGFSVVFDYTRFTDGTDRAKRNEIISRLILLFDENEQEWVDALPLEIDAAGTPFFPDDRENEIRYLKSKDLLNMNDYATAENCFAAAVEKYELQDYDPRMARDIASVYYSMFKTQFSAAAPYTFASDVPIELVAVIKEKNFDFTGVDAQVVTYREYPDGTIAPHLLGVVGVMNETEYAAKTAQTTELLADDTKTDEQKKQIKKRAYAMNDVIGKTGVEAVMESYLRGTAGERTIRIDADGAAEEFWSATPQTGNTVILTLDRDLQKVAQQALRSRILELTGYSDLEAAGAVVVLDTTNGEVLAAASYPSYDLSTYYEDYNELAADPAAPLWNRTLQSTYAPGSTMKPAMALAGLQEGVINRGTTFYCSSKFEYMDHVFGCLSAHGSLNVENALKYSCNIFFYNVADKLGINRMNRYSTMFGLGSKTGIELAEAAGVLASPAHRNARGLTWYSGDAIQAAIGQSDNLFTPIQLANYVATIANGGTRWVPHIVKSVCTADFSETVFETEPEVAATAEVSAENFNIVREGMLLVTTEGSVRETFSQVQEKCAGKTGTSQVKKIVNGALVKGNNGFFISYGPYESPELAIAVVVENVDSGSATADVAAEIYKYWFSRTDSVPPAQAVGVVLE